MTIIPVLGRQIHEHGEFKGILDFIEFQANLSYMKPSLKTRARGGRMLA
jgi:hypothetical protein